MQTAFKPMSKGSWPQLHSSAEPQARCEQRQEEEEPHPQGVWGQAHPPAVERPHMPLSGGPAASLCLPTPGLGFLRPLLPSPSSVAHPLARQPSKVSHGPILQENTNSQLGQQGLP